MNYASLADRFWRKAKLGSPAECWPWMHGKDKDGYGVFSLGKKSEGSARAHRMALSLSMGRAIRPGLLVLHSCDNASCVNPAHLREGTTADNVRDAVVRMRRKPPCELEHWNAKLSDDDVMEILEQVKAGTSQASVARKYNVHPSLVNKLFRKRTRQRLFKEKSDALRSQ